MMFVIGVTLGLAIGLILHFVSLTSYKRILVMKSIDKTPEKINSEFYYIVPEKEWR
jgi:hypothetical protein